MPLAPQNSEDLIHALSGQWEGIAQALNRCFDLQCQLQPQIAGALERLATSTDLDGPGVLFSLTVSETTLLVAIPATLPLPGWYASPDQTQSTRLDALALEWSRSCIPSTVAAENFGTCSSSCLWDSIQDCRPSASSTALPVAVTGTSARIWFIWPVAKEPGAPATMSAPPAVAAIPTLPQFPRTSRIVSVPVKVVVQLAEKKIQLGQLRGLAPGSLVMFDKSCEDLLNLYVNNQLFCRGEAVKVGEKFGLKVNEVGPVERRVSPVINRSNRS